MVRFTCEHGRRQATLHQSAMRVHKFTYTGKVKSTGIRGRYKTGIFLTHGSNRTTDCITRSSHPIPVEFIGFDLRRLLLRDRLDGLRDRLGGDRLSLDLLGQSLLDKIFRNPWGVCIRHKLASSRLPTSGFSYPVPYHRTGIVLQEFRSEKSWTPRQSLAAVVGLPSVAGI